MRTILLILLTSLVASCNTATRQTTTNRDTIAIATGHHEAPVVTESKSRSVDVDQKVTLTGVLRLKMFYGAPNFGEDTLNDNKEPTYILHLDSPIFFRDITLSGRVSNEDFEAVKEIQVRALYDDTVTMKELATLGDKRVKLTCTLYGAINGHDHAPACTEKILVVTQAE